MRFSNTVFETINLTQGRINQYARYALAWGPPFEGGPLLLRFNFFQLHSTKLMAHCI